MYSKIYCLSPQLFFADLSSEMRIVRKIANDDVCDDDDADVRLVWEARNRIFEGRGDQVLGNILRGNEWRIEVVVVGGMNMAGDIVDDAGDKEM
jgi:hypothetical protein